jgi:lipoyl(octanoyl) transferase
VTLKWQWLGRVEYLDAVHLMESQRARILDGSAGDVLFLLEHAPVVTLGRSAKREHVLATEEGLRARGITLATSSRGGDVTYHGPGQLVAYPVMRLSDGVVAHVERLAGAAVDVAAQFSVEARFDRARPGVWVGDEKLAAVGVHVHRRVAIHGLSLNVTTAPSAFQVIVPCGLRDARVTSLARLIGRTPPPLPQVAADFAAAFARRYRREASATGERSGLLLHPSSVE